MLIKSLESLIGNTPLYELQNIEKKYDLKCRIFAKLENRNLSGSVKDRAALSMIYDAEKRGILKKGDTIIEPTSGNTGIALAALGKMRGYHVVLTMPESMSEERKKLLKMYGAKLILTGASLGMDGAREEAKRLQTTTPGSIILSQFENPANPNIHFVETAKEIFDDLDGQIDIIVSGIGTGGTITGLAQYFKERKPDVLIIGVEPASSSVITTGKKGPHKIQGIGAGFIPKILNLTKIDQVMTVSDEDALLMKSELMMVEALNVGISSGAALSAALHLSKQYHDKNIVIILPDSGDRYYGSY